MKKIVKGVCALSVCMMVGCKQETGSVPSAQPTEKPTVSSEVTPVPEPVDYVSMYDDLLDTYSAVLHGAKIATEEGFDKTKEVLDFTDIYDKPSYVGYWIEDVSGDDVPELIIGPRIQLDDSSWLLSEVFAVYTIQEEEPKLLFEAQGPESYDRLNNNRFLYMTTEPDGKTCFGVFTLDGQTKKWEEFVFTEDREHFYTNTTGEMDISSSTLSDYSFEEYMQRPMNLIQENGDFSYIPFSMYGYDVFAEWQNASILKKYKEFSNYVVNEDGEMMVISSFHELKDVELLSLEFVDVDEDGNLSMNTDTLYSTDSVFMQKPLMVYALLEGTVPNLGISFVDSDGEKKFYTFSLSGLAGSIVIQPFTPVE